jgi:hypothetical protein
MGRGSSMGTAPVPLLVDVLENLLVCPALFLVSRSLESHTEKMEPENRGVPSQSLCKVAGHSQRGRSPEMNPTFKVDTSDFTAKFQEYAEVNKRGIADLANAKMLQLAFEAQRETPIAKGVKQKLLRYVEQHPEVWAGFIVKRLKKKGYRKGQWNRVKFHRAALAEHKRILGIRARAEGSLRAGYIPAIKRLWPLVKDRDIASKVTIGGAKQFGKDKGTATPAVPGEAVFAEVTNSMKGIEQFGTEAMERAKMTVMQDMDVYIERKLQEEIDKFFK